ncbi:MAG: HIT domain-containing protein, partial [Candidatus Dadabacteria bacterium]
VSGCPFCPPPADRVVWQNASVVILRDRYPVTPGHMLVVPRRHVPTWFDALPEERQALTEAIDVARRIIEHERSPAGFNIGINVGEAAGQTVFHLHVHVIPRYPGDTPNPRGGVRHVIPGRGDYKVGSVSETAALYASATAPALCPALSPLVTGEQESMLERLRAELGDAEGLDAAVAFVAASGIELLAEPLAGFLSRGGRLRLVTTDYLGVTEPEALERLLEICARTSSSALLRIFEASERRRFHPKAYIFHRPGKRSCAYIGSSNLTEPGLTAGVEWNIRVAEERDPEGFAAVAQAFERLLDHEATGELTSEWIEAYRERRPTVAGIGAAPTAASDQAASTEARETAGLAGSGEAGGAGGDRSTWVGPAPVLGYQPTEVQRQALAALAQTRLEGNRAGLVVLATGLGKTWLAAFDSSRPEFRRTLFVAHREEILEQASSVFARVRPNARIGRYGGGFHEAGADVVVASIQTLSRPEHLERFRARDFDYVVIDEFHHAYAPSYRRVIDYFEPRFLLGMTATPERSDGGDLLALCGENVVYRCDLAEGIRRGLLLPFKYLGVPDEVEYGRIPWRNGKFDEEALTRAWATQAQAANVLEQYRRLAGRRTLAFCCSVRHADFMRDYFRKNGVRAAAVHSGPTADGRAESLEALARGDLDVLFTVDMLNEGFDEPLIDTIMMLRPTESRLLWFQQLGRGLRRAPGVEKLTVGDYVGNHRIFLTNIQALFGLPAGDEHVARVIAQLRSGCVELPPGCSVTYELKAIDMLERLLRFTPPHSVPVAHAPAGRPAVNPNSRRVQELLRFTEDFMDRYARRPTAAEAYHEGFWTRQARAHCGRSWIAFLHWARLLDRQQQQVWAHPTAGSFLHEVEKTVMTRSYKMVVLLAMLKMGVLPGRVRVADLARSVGHLVGRSKALRWDFSADPDNHRQMAQLLVRNPLTYLCRSIP